MAHVAPRVPAVADGVLPLLQVAPGRGRLRRVHDRLRDYDGAKRLSGRKRHLLVDTGGLVLGARVHAASLHDRDGARVLLSDELKEELPRFGAVVGGRRVHARVSRVGQG